jgi:anti-sigma B factor antagonist
VDLAIDVSARGDATVVTLAGDLDIQTAPAVRDRLDELSASGGVVVIDLSAVEFLDSSGLGAFVGAAGALGRTGGSLRLACPRPHIQKILGISRLVEVIPVYDDVESACNR